jgi:cell division protein FtsB
MRKGWILWLFTGTFFLLLLTSDVFLWREHSFLRQKLNEKAEMNQTLRWQAEVAIEQSQSLYSYYKSVEICTESCADANSLCISNCRELRANMSEKCLLNCVNSCSDANSLCVSNCWQDSDQRIPDLISLSDLPPGDEAILDSRTGLWILGHFVLLALWGAVVVSYLKLSDRYQSLKFDYDNLLEAKRRDERRIKQLESRVEDLLEAKRRDEGHIKQLESRIEDLLRAKR